MTIEKVIDLLGMPCRDKVTEFAGVITSVTFDLYGCIQALVHPGMDKDKKLKDQNWFDIDRLEITGNEPVMYPPKFKKYLAAKAINGAAEKPLSNKA